jgi:hypothetical protein
MPARKVGENAGNRGKGRKKGVPNKATATIKAAFLEAFQQRGGVPALMKWADDEPTEFYKLASKLIPTEVSGPDGGPVQIALQTWKFGDKQVAF